MKSRPVVPYVIFSGSFEDGDVGGDPLGELCFVPGVGAYFRQ
jgi:hypothetical protein